MGGGPGNCSGPMGICSKMYGLGLKKAQRSPTRGEWGQVLGGELATGPGAMGTVSTMDVCHGPGIDWFLFLLLWDTPKDKI